MQSIDPMERYSYGTSEDVFSEKEEIKYNKMIQKMIKFNDVTKENIKNHNPNWQQIPDDPYLVLIIGGFGSGKTNSLFNLINQ